MIGSGRNNNDMSRQRPPKMTKITIINTNAPSLRPKLGSFLDCMSEMDVDFAILTETWMQDRNMDELTE